LGNIIWNNTTQISATAISVAHLTNDNIDVDIILATLYVGQLLIIQDADVSGNYQKWLISGTSTNFNPNSNTSYWEYPVTISTYSGTFSFFDTQPIVLATIAQSSLGPQGSQGPTGPIGSSGTSPDWYFQGAWPTGLTPFVLLGDIYTYQGSTWYNDTGSATGTPSIANGWSLLAERGNTGPQGPAGSGGGGGSSVYATTSSTRSTSILTDAATISISLTSSNSGIFTVTLGGDRTLQNPTDMPTGTDVKYFGIIVTQDNTGGRTLSYDTQYNTGDIDTDLNFATASRTHLYFMASSGLVELIGKRT
jgi:hypothetical protein